MLGQADINDTLEYMELNTPEHFQSLCEQLSKPEQWTGAHRVSRQSVRHLIDNILFLAQMSINDEMTKEQKTRYVQVLNRFAAVLATLVSFRFEIPKQVRLQLEDHEICKVTKSGFAPFDADPSG